ncbi:hypothetical protein A1O7_10142 [Cladophialophora yegresii CBS 114405]|uniref:Uncharacterized protein n=1 Tax=Cladophialophora yegresii CBS 114405 TaxID=1182544 RepID=W9VRK9_9EURO|nr:uncharacterized protein A1O7_10142 [Cladophialophora yegresii CBS 114405]EXJ54801.1 hypothetical protein A1O7_10142 [Cladophialophora yegresii CBS 114405]
MPSANEKSTMVETASVRSTSTTSSLKALLPRKSSKDSKDASKSKTPAVSPRETPEEKAIRMEAVAGYMGMMRY